MFYKNLIGVSNLLLLSLNSREIWLLYLTSMGRTRADALHGQIDPLCQIGGRKKRSKVRAANLAQDDILASLNHLLRNLNFLAAGCRVRNATLIYILLMVRQPDNTRM